MIKLVNSLPAKRVPTVREATLAVNLRLGTSKLSHVHARVRVHPHTHIQSNETKCYVN